MAKWNPCADKVILSVQKPNIISIWDVENKSEFYKFQVNLDRKEIKSCDWNYNGSKFLAAWSKTLKIWNSRSMFSCAEINTELEPERAIFLKDDRVLVFGFDGPNKRKYALYDEVSCIFYLKKIYLFELLINFFNRRKEKLLKAF